MQLGFESLESRLLLTATLASDFNAGTDSSFPSIAVVEGRLWISLQNQTGISSLAPDGSVTNIDTGLESFQIIASNDRRFAYVVGSGSDTSRRYRTNVDSLSPLRT